MSVLTEQMVKNPGLPHELVYRTNWLNYMARVVPTEVAEMLLRYVNWRIREEVICGTTICGFS